MRADYDTSGPGKFEGEPPMARFLFERIVLQGFSDDSCSHEGSGFWADRIGRRMILGDGQGFVWYVRYATEAEALEAFQAHEDYCYDEEEAGS